MAPVLTPNWVTAQLRENDPVFSSDMLVCDSEIESCSFFSVIYKNMPTLKSQVLTPDYADKFITECADLIESHVHNRSGFKGIAYRTALGAAKKVKPDILKRSAGNLMPDMLEALEPLYQQFKQSADSDFSAFITKHREQAAEAVLSVTDNKAAHAENKTLRAGYKKLRGGAHDEIIALVPDLASLAAQYTKS